MNKKSIQNCTYTLILCAATAALTSCTIPNTAVLETEGKNIASSALESQKNKWNADTLYEKVGPPVQKKDLVQAVQMFDQVLGPIKEIGTLHEDDQKVNAGIIINTPDFTALYRAEVTCERGKGMASVVVAHQDGKWSIRSININSKAFDKFGEEERIGADVFVNKVVQTYCTTADVADLKKNSSAAMLDSLNKNQVLTAVFSGTIKALGKIGNFSGAQFTNVALNQGDKVYIYTGLGHFEHGTANVIVGVVKENGAWKVNSFNIQSTSGSKQN